MKQKKLDFSVIGAISLLIYFLTPGGKEILESHDISFGNKFLTLNL